MPYLYGHFFHYWFLFYNYNDNKSLISISNIFRFCKNHPIEESDNVKLCSVFIMKTDIRFEKCVFWTFFANVRGGDYLAVTVVTWQGRILLAKMHA